jgi:hypothetical protein
MPQSHPTRAAGTSILSWNRPFCLIILALAVLLVRSPVSGEIIDTPNFSVVDHKVAEFSKQFGARNVLVVFDADNTLLAMNQDLGSNQWYEWQSDLQKKHPNSPYLVGKTFPELLAAQGTIFSLGNMHTPESKIPACIAKYQAAGTQCMVLTARGTENRDATQRELKRNKLKFQSADKLFQGLPSGSWYPYDPKNIAASGLTNAEQTEFKLGAPRNVSFGNGVMMVAGQHKGAMLLIMLAHCPQRFSAIVFVDDSSTNTKNVFHALTKRNYPNAVIRYGAEDKNVKAFDESDKTAVDKQWRKLDATIQSVFK